MDRSLNGAAFQLGAAYIPNRLDPSFLNSTFIRWSVLLFPLGCTERAGTIEKRLMHSFLCLPFLVTSAKPLRPSHNCRWVHTVFQTEQGVGTSTTLCRSGVLIPLVQFRISGSNLVEVC